MKTENLLGSIPSTMSKLSQQPRVTKVHFGPSHEQLNSNFTNSNNNFAKWNTHGTNQQQQHI